MPQSNLLLTLFTYINIDVPIVLHVLNENFKRIVFKRPSPVNYSHSFGSNNSVHLANELVLISAAVLLLWQCCCGSVVVVVLLWQCCCVGGGGGGVVPSLEGRDVRNSNQNMWQLGTIQCCCCSAVVQQWWCCGSLVVRDVRNSKVVLWCCVVGAVVLQCKM